VWNFEVSFWLFPLANLSQTRSLAARSFVKLLSLLNWRLANLEMFSGIFPVPLWRQARNTNKRVPLSQLHFSLEKALIKSSQLWWLGVFQKQVKLVPKRVSSHKFICEAFKRRKTCALKCKNVEQRSAWFLPGLANSQAQVQVLNRKFSLDMCFLSTPHNSRTCMLAPKTQKQHCNRKSLDKLKCLCTRSHHAWRNWNAVKTSNAL